jgi:hypothetical protein
MSDTVKESVEEIVKDVARDRLFVEFETDGIAVTEEELPDGFRIREEGKTLGVDIEKRGHRYRLETHAWDEIKMKLAKDTVESIVSEAEITHRLGGMGKRIAEELSELD